MLRVCENETLTEDAPSAVVVKNKPKYKPVTWREWEHMPQVVETLSENYKVKYVYDPEFSLSNLDLEKHKRENKTRFSKPVHKDKVEKWLLTNATLDPNFPCVVVTPNPPGQAKPYTLVDGVHRCMFCEARGLSVLGAYILTPVSTLGNGCLSPYTIKQFMSVCNKFNGIAVEQEDSLQLAYDAYINESPGVSKSELASRFSVNYNALLDKIKFHEIENKMAVGGPLHVDSYDRILSFTNADRVLLQINRLGTNVVKKALIKELTNYKSIPDSAVKDLVDSVVACKSSESDQLAELESFIGREWGNYYRNRSRTRKPSKIPFPKKTIATIKECATKIRQILDTPGLKDKLNDSEIESIRSVCDDVGVSVSSMLIKLR